jgi:hypothetical protein
VESGVIVPCPDGRYWEDWREEPIMLDGETYLRLAAIDLDDPQAIFAFVNKFGPLGGVEAYDATTRMAHRIANVYRTRLDRDADYATKLRVLREDHARTGSGDAWPSEEYRFHFTETLDECRFAARCLRDLTAGWRMYRDGTTASKVRWLSPDESDPELLSEFPEVLLTRLLPEVFLRPFSPYLTFYWEPTRRSARLYDHPPGEEGVHVDPQRRPVTNRLYPILALELFNHIVENADYLICGNENCQQKNFVHQQGRKKKWHRSKGVDYCSYACAHAVAQRRYRQKQRLNRERGDSGAG